MTDFEIRPWDGSDADLSSVVDVYAEAFAEPPYGEDPEVSRTEFPLRVRRYAAEKPDFRLLLAVEAEVVVGFVLGTGIGPGDWWWSRLDDALADEVRADWLRPRQFSIAELAIAPHHRRAGVGRALMREVLDGIPYDSALLGCLPEAEPAKRLYGSMGWTVIDPAAQITATRRVQVMGLRLVP